LAHGRDPVVTSVGVPTTTPLAGSKRSRATLLLISTGYTMRRPSAEMDG
jgi:hypothetical protein